MTKGQWDVPSFGNPSPWVPWATLFLSPSSTQHYKTRATSFKGIVQFPNRLYSGVGGYNSPLVPQALTTNALFRWEVERKHLSVGVNHKEVRVVKKTYRSFNYLSICLAGNGYIIYLDVRNCNCVLRISDAVTHGDLCKSSS